MRQGAIPVEKLLPLFDYVIVILVIEPIIVELPLLLPMLAALLVLRLLRPPLLLCIVDLVDVLVRLDQIHRELPQGGRRSVAIGGRFGHHWLAT